jgi:VIT1/CCC1 family predicted Fe2+/Mn2+ transporter
MVKQTKEYEELSRKVDNIAFYNGLSFALIGLFFIFFFTIYVLEDKGFNVFGVLVGIFVFVTGFVTMILSSKEVEPPKKCKSCGQEITK